jgi:uncharacterized protein YqeY
VAEGHSPFCFLEAVSKPGLGENPMGLKAQITDDMKAAMRSRDAQRLSAIRLLLAAIKQREVDERKELDDQEVIAVVEKMIKQRRESIAQYEKASRADLVAAENFELEVLQAYMPQPLSQAEIEAAVAAAVSGSGAQSVRDMGKVMAILKAELAGRADMAAVSALVKARLGN